MNEDLKIIFVYNADSGVINAIKDYFHKIISPSTYECNLCGISFGLGGMKREWKEYIKELSIPVEFLHRNEFEVVYPNEREEYPNAWIKSGSNIELIISAEEMNQPKTLRDLISLTNKKLDEKNLI